MSWNLYAFIGYTIVFDYYITISNGWILKMYGKTVLVGKYAITDY